MHVDWKLSRDELERNYDVYLSYKKLDQDRKNKMSENKSIFKYIEVGRYINILNDIKPSYQLNIGQTLKTSTWLMKVKIP